MYSLSWPTAEASTPEPTYGHAGELQQALEGAVLAVRAVQHGEDDVDLAERLGHGAGLAVDDLAVGRVDGEHDAALGGLGELLDARQSCGRRWPSAPGSSAVSAQRPSVRDADRQHVVLRTVDGAQHGAGGDHGDAVLGAAAAEDDGYARLAGLLLRALGEVLAAHIAMRLPARLSGNRRQRRSGLGAA